MNGDKEYFPWSADHVNRIGNLPVDFYSATSICYDNSSSTNISYLNILYIVVDPAPVDIGSNPVSKDHIQPECGE